MAPETLFVKTLSTGLRINLLLPVLTIDLAASKPRDGGEQGLRAACGEPANDSAHAGALAGQDGRSPAPPKPCFKLFKEVRRTRSNAGFLLSFCLNQRRVNL